MFWRMYLLDVKPNNNMGLLLMSFVIYNKSEKILNNSSSYNKTFFGVCHFQIRQAEVDNTWYSLPNFLSAFGNIEICQSLVFPFFIIRSVTVKKIFGANSSIKYSNHVRKQTSWDCSYSQLWDGIVHKNFLRKEQSGF